MNLSYQDITELGARGWTWDGEVLTSPSGKKVEHPTEFELLRLRRGESIDTVLAERKSGRARETAGSEDSPRHLLDRLANNLTKILAAAGKLNPYQK